MTIHVWSDETKTWTEISHPPDLNTAQTKAWLRVNGKPGRYRIIELKWVGTLAPKDETLLVSKK